MARTLKDSICRYKTMKGFKSERRAGWDTHGLPVEIEVEKKLGFSGKQDIENFGIKEFNEKCRESVFEYEALWKDMMESVDIKENVQPDPSIPDVNEWCIRGGRREDGSVHRIKGLFNVPEECEAFNEELAKKYDKIRENEVM